MSEISKKHKSSEDSDESDHGISSGAVQESGMTMLECLSNLSSFDRALRMTAAESLVQQLVNEQGTLTEACENLQLVVERLVVGLASGREASRQGFSVVLTELLRQFKQVSLAKVLSLVEEKMDATGEKGDVEKQIYLGKIFAVACIVRSGRLASEKATARVEILSQLFGILVAMFEKKSYMKELVANTMIELVSECSGSDDELRKVAIPSLSGLLNVPPEDCSPESLALLLSLPGDAHSFNAEWKKNTPLLKQSDLIKGALLASSYTHPRVHFVWRLVVDACFKGSNDLVRSVWSLVDSALFGSHVDNRKFLAFSLLAIFVQRATLVEDVVFFLAQPNTTRALVNHLASNKKTKMTDVAGNALEELKKKVSGMEGLGMALLQARYLAPINLDHQIVPILSAEEGVSYLRNLLSGFNKEQGERIVSAIKRGWKKWGQVEESKASLSSLSTSIVQVFAKLAFLSDVEADKQWGKMRLFSILAELEATGHANLIALCQWLQPQMKELESDAKKLLSKAIGLSGSGGNRYEQSFVKTVGLVTLLSVLNEEETNMGQWEDVVTAHSKFVSAVKDKDIKERNKSVLVLVSIMIELLTASSALNRVVVVNAFRLIAPMIPERGVKDIVESIVATENEDVGEEDDGGDDDEDGGENGNIDMDALNDALNVEEFEDIRAGENLPDIPLDEADPEYLSRIEESLGNIFRAMREKKNQSKKSSSALDFKLRCVDLLENFVHCVSRMSSMDALPFEPRSIGDNRSVIFTLLPQLIAKIKKTQHSGSLKPLYDKLRRVVMKEICEIQSYPSMSGHGRLLLKSLRAVMVFASTGNPTQEFASVLERAITILVKVLSRDNVMASSAICDTFQKPIEYCCTRKNLKFLSMDKFFLPVFRRVPDVGTALLPRVAEWSASASWTQPARLSAVLAGSDFVLRSGKSHLIAHPTSVLGCIQSVERMFLSFLRYETGKTKLNAVVQAVTGVHGAFVEVLTDPRLGNVEKSQIYNCLPLRSDIAQALDALIAKHAQSTKLAQAAKKLKKLFHLEE